MSSNPVTTTHVASLVGLALTLALVACGNEGPPQRQPTREVATPQAAVQGVCALVSSEEMSNILGGAVKAHDDRSNECRYFSTDNPAMYATLTVDRGGGEAAMTAMGIARRIDRDLSNPLAGLGDQATIVGPSVWIRRGDDLVMIVTSGTIEHARRIYERVDRRLARS